MVKPVDALDKVLQERTQFSLDVLANQVLAKFGREEGLANELYDTYVNSNQGSSTRKAILDSVFKLLLVVGSRDGSIEGLDDEELRAEAAQILGNLGPSNSELG